MSVGEVGSVNVAIWMVCVHHRRENISDVFWEPSCQVVGFHAECIHLFKEIIALFFVMQKSIQLYNANNSQRNFSAFVCLKTFPHNPKKQLISLGFLQDSAFYICMFC